MGWSIACIENTIRFTEEGVEAFNKFARAHDLYAAEADDYEGLYTIYFDPDHMEHMDYMWKNEVQDALKLGKANGRALFGSLEGDNEGEFWGYEFKDGVMTRLTGTVTWGKD